MLINTEQMISMSEANQNFSRVARMVDQEGQAIILKNNVPRYLVIEFSQAEQEQTASDEDVREASMGFEMRTCLSLPLQLPSRPLTISRCIRRSNRKQYGFAMAL